MAYFSHKLQELLDRNEMSQTDLARSTGLSQAHISRLLSDDQKSVSLADLENITINISSKPQERAELIRSHLLDECVGPGSELIDIVIREGRGQYMALYDLPGAPPLSPRLERAFEILRRHSDDKYLRTVIEGLGDLMDDDPLSSTLANQIVADEISAVAAKTVGASASYKSKPPTVRRSKVPRAGGHSRKAG